MAEQPSTVTMADIARLAELHRPAVSNWRRRHTDFPKPVTEGNPPRFDVAEIAEWLTTRGLPDGHPERGSGRTTYADVFAANLASGTTPAKKQWRHDHIAKMADYREETDPVQLLASEIEQALLIREELGLSTPPVDGEDWHALVTRIGAADVRPRVGEPPFVATDARSDRHPVIPVEWALRESERLVRGLRAYVAVPAWTLTAAAASRELRRRADDALRELLASRALRAVVQLPRRIETSLVGTELALLVLEERRDGATAVTLCDVNRLPPKEWQRTVARIVAFGPAEGDEHAVHTSALGELRAGSTLWPAYAQQVPVDPVDHMVSLLDAQRDMAEPMPRLRRIQRIPTVRLSASRRDASIADLANRGIVRVLQGHRIDQADLNTDQGWVVAGPDEVTGARALGSRRIDPFTLGLYNAADLTERNDVLVSPTVPVRAIVDHDGVTVPLSPVTVLRIVDTQQLARLTPRVLAFLVQASRQERYAAGTLARRVKVRDLRLPDLGPKEVSLLDETLRELEEQRAQIAERLALLDHLTHVLREGVADGALGLATPRVEIDNEPLAQSVEPTDRT